ncbi:MAG: phage tail sheath C-terminal domain-containing protein [Myxococcota bacterium]
MSKIRSPGVYIEKTQDRVPMLAMGPSGQPGFLGLTTRGPLHQPVRITSYAHFLDAFGAPLEGSYLPKAVEGFFNNGGEICYVVRVAHTFRRGRSRVATVAQQTLADRNGEATMRIEARDQGTWGNDIRVTVRTPDPKVQTLMTRDLEPGQTQVGVRSGRGFQVGSVCRISDGKQERYVTINRVSSRELGWLEQLDVGFRSSAPTIIEPITVEITAEVPGYRETFDNLSFASLSGRYFERLVNTESELIRVYNLESKSKFPHVLPVEVERLQLQGGTDGLRDIQPADFIGMNNGPGMRFGLGALEEIDEVDIIVIPDLFAAPEISAARGGRGFRNPRTGKVNPRDFHAVQEAMVSHCERLRTRLALLDMPPKASYEEAQAWRLMFDSDFAALYYPWIVLAGGDGPRNKIIVPPSGHIAGVYARSDHEYGVQKPPANEELIGAIDLDTLLNDAHLAELNNKGINCIKYIPFRGIRVWGARTMSSDPQWRYINVRRIINSLRMAIEYGTQWVVFEPNDADLWARVNRTVSNFLERLWREGALFGSSPSEAFYVKCDGEINTHETMMLGRLYVEVGVCPVRPAEFVIFRISQWAPNQ